MAGRDADAAAPTASEYFRYVSIDATTTRASTVIRSMPTSETRTHASMTIPLSRTRSRTSIRLVPPAARSTAISKTPWSRSVLGRSRRAPATAGCRGQRGEPTFKRMELLAQLEVLLHHLFATGREMPVVLPPVEAD